MDDEEQNIEEVYNDEAREDLVENDQISPEEEGFMAGYENQKEKVKKNLEGDEAYESAFEEKKTKGKRR